MYKDRKYTGKITLSYQTRSEQLAIERLYELLEVSPIQDLVFILDGYDARQAAEIDPDWAVGERENER